MGLPDSDTVCKPTNAATGNYGFFNLLSLLLCAALLTPQPGLHWYMAIPNMREERLERLVNAYADVLAEHEAQARTFGAI